GKAARRASPCVWKRCRSRSSPSSVAKKLSHSALSYASPTLPIEGRTPASAQRLPNATDVYRGPARAEGEVSATSVPIHRPQKNHPHSQCRHDHEYGGRHHTLRSRHVLGTVDRQHALHRDSAEYPVDE